MKRPLALLSLLLPVVLGAVAAGCGSSSSNDGNPVILSPRSGTVLSPDAFQYEFYEERFTVTGGGTAPFAFAEVPGGLPDGLFLVMTDSTGEAILSSGRADLIGFPEDDGLQFADFEVIDAKNAITSVFFDLNVATSPTPGLILSPSTGTSLPTGTSGDPYTPTILDVSNGTLDYTWSIVYGGLPPGMTLVEDPSGFDSSEAEVRGTPTAAGTWIFAVEVTDASGTTRYGGAVYQVRIQ